MKILYYDGDDQAKRKQVEAIITQANISLIMVETDQGAATLAELLEGHGSNIKQKKLPPIDLMVFEGFTDDAIMEISTALQKESVSVERKCVVTKSNRSWQFAQLLQEICEEHVYMNRMIQCQSLLREVSTYQENDYTKESWQKYEFAFMSGALLLQQEHATKAQLDAVVVAIIHTRDHLIKK